MLSVSALRVHVYMYHFAHKFHGEYVYHVGHSRLKYMEVASKSEA